MTRPQHDAETDPASPLAGEVVALPPVGTVLSDRYVLDRLIGQGGMGWVFRANDTALQRAVAIKILLPTLSKIPEIYARFGREAKAIAGLDHPNVVPVFDVGHTEPWHYFVMKLLEGEPLSQRIGLKGMPIGEAVETASQVLAGLEHMHGRGLIHRDIKPGNVLITHDGRAVILDFGILRNALGAVPGVLEPRMTAAGLFVGTPEYVAPEIVRSSPGDARSDLYGLGITLYEMLTGVIPFDGGSAVEIAARRLRETPLPPRGLRPEIPQAVEDVILRALQRDPDARFPSAAAMRESLSMAAKGTPLSGTFATTPRAPSVAITQVLESPASSALLRRAGIALAAVSLLAIGLFVLWPEGAPPVVAEAPVAQARPQMPFVPPPLPPPIAPRQPSSEIPAPLPAEPVDAPVVAPAVEPSPVVPAEPSTPEPTGRRQRGPAQATAPAVPSPAPAPTAPAPSPAPVASPTKGSTLERARAALRAGQNAEALRLFLEASRASPGSAAPLRGLGDAQLAVGNRTAAMGAYRRYLALDPNARDAAAVRARLEALGGH